jgi:hypothetical protein
MKQLAHSVWRRSRPAMAEVDRLTGEVAGLASRCGRSRWSATPAAGLAVDQMIGRLGGCPARSRGDGPFVRRSLKLAHP